MEKALRQDALQTSAGGPMVSDMFERRILQAVREAGSHAPATRAHSWFGPWVVGGVAAAAVAVMLVVVQREPARRGVDVVANPMVAADAAMVVDAVESLSNQFVESVIPSAGQLVARNPLQQEIGSVYSDMRSALDFLALNFLPAATRQEAPARTI